MKKLATNSLPTKANKDSNAYQVGDGVKKPPRAQSFRPGNYIAHHATTRGGTSPESSKGIIEAALEIARNRRETLDRIRDAFSRNDEAKVLQLTKELCGIRDDEEGNASITDSTPK